MSAQTSPMPLIHLDHSSRDKVTASVILLTPYLRSPKCFLRAVYGVQVQNSFSPNGCAAAIHAPLLQGFSVLLLLGEKTTRAAAECHQPMYPLCLCLLAILLLEPADEWLLVGFEVVVVAVVKLIHLL
jgi:hypothetical protein